VLPHLHEHWNISNVHEVNMETKIFKIKKGLENEQRVSLFVDWCDFLCEHKEEALETLREENLLEESITLVTSNGHTYFLCKRKLEQGKDLLPSNQDKAINRVHKKLWSNIDKEVVSSLENFEENKILYSFKIK
jgi:hypothetical protein